VTRIPSCTIVSPSASSVLTASQQRYRHRPGYRGCGFYSRAGGAPEPAVADGKGMIYDNLEDKNEVIAIDSRTLKITARWPVAPAGQPVSIAMDRQRRARLGTFRLLIYGR
jgi:hypothetical protein